jgi:hypothetical protein
MYQSFDIRGTPFNGPKEGKNVTEPEGWREKLEPKEKRGICGRNQLPESVKKFDV